ncbi:maleylpyruvate isomerase family mycothiol-dependent enzyme [Micromonospora polyrhachis]|uniref:Maleylpyruvate isomerase n=1 Tax=Micromonospora polyrhachis TaxID=1282883 RepID=A0A7W7WSA4_9ACTN|nr:maleylpyruvate isomerase family mycothiol-dependent enzyme [Micromonospora polyrhachis]MBB4961442.1 maleylpyruvate isomerase [Micromonospora polyrhachis]
MTADPLLLMGEVDLATERLLQSAASLDEAGLAGPSLLPGWTRGHVLAHLARQADAMINLLTAARTGEDIPAYASPADREADIEAGAGRTLAIHLDDLRESTARFAAVAAAMPVEAWAATVIARGGPRVAATLVWSRLREVEVHHVDLAAGYAPTDWPEACGHRLLHEVVTDLAGRSDVPPLVLTLDGAAHQLTIGEPDGAPTITGPVNELAGWLIGRSSGDGLTVTPAGPLPVPPRWL